MSHTIIIIKVYFELQSIKILKWKFDEGMEIQNIILKSMQIHCINRFLICTTIINHLT